MRYVISVLILALFSFPAYADELEERVKAVEDALKAQETSMVEQGIAIDELKYRAFGAQANATRADGASPGLFGGSALTNPNISLILNAFYYGSNLPASELSGRRMPGYVNEGIGAAKGFNLESAELFIFAPADPYFNLYATMPIGEEGIELEEAYFITTSLLNGLQAKGGKFKSGFGRINGQHPHQWDFADSPLPYRAFIGSEGIIEKGVQFTYLPALPFYATLGIEALQGGNEILFDPEAESGPNAYAAFAKLSFDGPGGSTVLFGPSAAIGKTKTGAIADDTDFTGDSALYGLELTCKWSPSKDRGLTVQSEYLMRRQNGDIVDAQTSTAQRLERDQDGYYVQAVYKTGRWRFGARYDALDVFKDDYALAGVTQEFGKDPWRATTAIEYNPTEFSKVRLQYNHDDSSRASDVNHEVMLQIILGIGAHSAHPF